MKKFTMSTGFSDVYSFIVLLDIQAFKDTHEIVKNGFYTYYCQDIYD